jgi:hypothetical protein
MQPAIIQLTRKINNALFGKKPMKMGGKNITTSEALTLEL